MITRIHHVGVVVKDLDLALGFWRDTLDLPVLHSAELPDQGVLAALLACGTSEVEVLVPTTPDTGIARFLASRGEGLHHVCFESDDVAREVRRLIGTGVDMIDEKPREGLAGKVAFVHPRACGKLLVELATPSSPRALARDAGHAGGRPRQGRGCGRRGAAIPGPVRDDPGLRGRTTARSSS